MSLYIYSNIIIVVVDYYISLTPGFYMVNCQLVPVQGTGKVVIKAVS